MEMIGSTVFYSMILFQSKSDMDLYSNDEVISSSIVAVGLAGAISIAGNQSGAGLNPVISISQNIFSYINTKKSEEFNNLTIYIFAPLIASFLSNHIYDYFKSEASKKHENPAIELGDSVNHS